MALQCAKVLLFSAALASTSFASSVVEDEVALSLDDACHDDSSASCRMEFRQLRAKREVALSESGGKWCQKPPAGKLWPPSAEGGAVDVKILSYNLFWWNLFGIRGGNGNSAAHLIMDNMKDKPFDIMGFQECDDGARVLGPVGLLSQYAVFQGNHAVCVAYRKGAWKELAKGTDDVGEDMGSHYYGKRGAVWIRLKHVETGKTMLFVNHHGPLEVNSGGQCGGESIANNLAILMQQRGKPGDILILVGDFNSNAASLTVTDMWTRLVLLHSGDSFGGVDNIFGNMDTSSLVTHKTLGSGGSDHHAIMAEVRVGGGRKLSKGLLPAPAASMSASALTKEPPGDDWQHFWCGRLEDQTEYVVPEGGWTLAVTADVGAPQRCCRMCQRHKECKSWVWVMWAGSGPLCKLSSLLPTQKRFNDQLVSGLSATTAAVLAAAEAKKTAIASLVPGAPAAAPDDAPAPVVEPAPAAASSGCKDAAPGDACYAEVQWARSDGIYGHPDWYPGLTASSSVSDFQKAVHASAPEKCPATCAAKESAAAKPAPVPSAASTPEPAEPTVTKAEDAVANATDTAPANATDTAPANATDTAAKASAKASAKAPVAAASSSCQDAKPGDACFKEIQWAKSDGIYGHPDWYPGLTPSSSNAEFQKVLSSSTNINKCPAPCA